MRTITKTLNVYQFHEAPPEVKEKIIDYMEQKTDYGSWILSDVVLSLKKLTVLANGRLDYSLSLTPDRYERVKIHEANIRELNRLISIKETCPLTGCCYDMDILEIIEKNYKKELSNSYENSVLTVNLKEMCSNIHAEYESILKPDVMEEHCNSNSYEFLASGELYHE